MIERGVVRAEGDFALRHGVPKRVAPAGQQVIEGRDVGAPSVGQVGHPLKPRVLIVELHFFITVVLYLNIRLLSTDLWKLVTITDLLANEHDGAGATGHVSSELGELLGWMHSPQTWNTIIMNET